MGDGEFTPLRGWGITVIRVVVGIVFSMHSGQKLFVLGFGGAAGIMVKAGIPAPMLAAIVVTMLELLGGLALIVGLFTRWVAILLAIDMFVAILTVHLPNGFFLPRGCEFALTLLAANVALAFLGSGEASVDQFLEERKT